MNSLQNLVKENRFFFSSNLFVLSVFGIYLCLVSRTDGFIKMNSFHTEFLNYFFSSATFIGDGLFTICISLLLVFFKKQRKLALILLIAYLSSGLFAQLFKALLPAPRPSLYFKLHNYNFYLETFATSRSGFTSFPSGHSSSAFALITVLAIFCKRKPLSIILITIGMVAGYSRIYLAHHFLIDVFVGAIIGIFFGSLSYVWIDSNWNGISQFFSQRRLLKVKPKSTNFPSLQQ